MEKIRQDSLAELRNVIVICCLSARWEERGKMTRDEAYTILKKGMFKAEGILKNLARDGNL